jgi:hypothetical protein
LRRQHEVGADGAEDVRAASPVASPRRHWYAKSIGAVPIQVPLVILGASQVLLLVAATEVLGMGEGGFGTLNAALVIGSFLAVFVGGRAARSGRTNAALVAFAVVGGASFALVAVAPAPFVAVGLLLLCGLCLTTTEVLSVTALQRNLSDTVLARVFGVADSLTVAAMLAGAAVAPLLVRSIGIERAIVAVGVLAPVVAVVARGSLRAQRLPCEDVRPLADLLAGLPFLSTATRPALEAMAARAVRGEIASGQVVVREGDLADDFYAILSGSFNVARRVDGLVVVVATLGPGEGFGELGLLGHVPRNATVVATSPSELLRVPGELLLRSVGTGAVNGGLVPSLAIVDRFTAR